MLVQPCYRLEIQNMVLLAKHDIIGTTLLQIINSKHDIIGI